MQSSTYLNWFRRLLLLGAVVAGLTAQAAGAVGRPPDVQDRADALNTTQGLKADGLRLEGIAQAYQQMQFGPTAQGLKADGLRLQGVAQAYQQLQPTVPDVFERFVTSHPYGSGLSAVEVQPPDIRDTAAAVAGPSPVDRIVAQERGRHGDLGLFGPSSSTAVPDVIERYATAHPYGSGLSSQEVSVPRPPDVTDAALAAQDSSFGSSSSFNWDDWAIGIGSGIGIALLLGGALVTSRQIRQRVRTA
jgi:hypothetical protein